MQCVIKNQEEGYMIRHEVAIGCQNKHEGKGFNLIGSDSGDMIWSEAIKVTKQGEKWVGLFNFKVRLRMRRGSMSRGMMYYQFS